MNARWSRSLLLLPLVLLASCQDEPLGPQPSQPGSPHFTSGAGRGLPAPVRNSIKYRDAGKKASRGSMAGASLTVRALLNADNTVDLAITAGTVEDLDRQTGPGNLDRIQIKVFDPHGNQISTNNYNRLRNGGFAAYVLSDLLRGSRVQVQANVSGFDPKRQEVLTVTDVVKIRPDLAAQQLFAPSQAPPHVPVSIGAIVAEVNGDVGARADCVLRVDGSEVDRARGIWVDAGSGVSCAFSHTFTATGTRSLTVAVTDVVPGDYDEGNNQVTGSIVIAHPSTNDFFVEARAEDLTRSYFRQTRSDWRWSLDGGVSFLHANSDYLDTVAGRHQHAAQWGSMNRELAFPMTIELRHASNGSDLANETFADVAADESRSGPGYRTDCAVRVHPSETAGDIWIEVCSGFSTVGGEVSGFTRIYQTRWAGEVTYFGHNYYRNWYGDQECVESCYADNWNNTQSAGMPLPELGSDYTMRTRLTHAATSATALVSVPLQPVNWSQRFPAVGEACYTWDHGPAWQYNSGTACSVDESSEIGVRGYGHASPDQ